MSVERVPTQKQLSCCLREIRKNIKSRENEKDVKDRLIEVTKHWDYGSNPQKTKSRLGVNTIYPRLDSNTFKKELSNIITNYDENDDIYKTASYLLRVTNGINFWLLKGVNNNGDKIFYDHDHGDIILCKQQLLTEFNLSSQIGQCWDVINERLYGCKLCVYYKGDKYYGSWIKVIDRDAFCVAFDVSREYRMSYCPAILVDIGGIDLMMVLSGSQTIDNQKHVGFGFCNIIKKKRKTAKIIDGHSMIHILQENKHDVYVQFYAVNNANINAADIEVTLEPHGLKKNDDHNINPIRLFPMQHNNEMNDNINNMTMNGQMNVNDMAPNPEMINNNMNNMNVSRINMMGNNQNMVPNQMEMNMMYPNNGDMNVNGMISNPQITNNNMNNMNMMVNNGNMMNAMNPNMSAPQFIDNQLPLNMNNREYNQSQRVHTSYLAETIADTNNITMNDQMNLNNNNNTNNIDVSGINMMVNNPNIVPNQMEIHNMNQINNNGVSLNGSNMVSIQNGMNMMNSNMSHPQFVDGSLPLSINNRVHNAAQTVDGSDLLETYDAISTIGYFNDYNNGLLDIQSVTTNDQCYIPESFGYDAFHTTTYSVEDTRVNPLGPRPI